MLRLQIVYALQVTHIGMIAILGGSFVDQDDLSADELGAACAAAH